MKPSWNGNILRFTDHLCWEFTGPRWIPHNGQWRGALMFSLICVLINSWVNNREAGDLRRHRAHYDVIVMNQCRLGSLTHTSSCLNELTLISKCLLFTSRTFEWQLSTALFQYIGTVKTERNGLHLADDIFKFKFRMKNWCILIQISLKFESKVPTINTSELVCKMARHRPDNMPIQYPNQRCPRLLTHICVTLCRY